MKALEYLLSRPLLCTAEAAEVAAAIVSRATEAPHAVESRRGEPAEGSERMTVRRGVAVIPVCGPIFRYSDYFTELCGGTTVDSLARDLQSALDNPAVRSVLLNVDSPGGEAAGIGELAAQIRAADATKPVCSYVGNQGCSAAYWIASAAGEVVCAEAAMLGSIGVVMGMTKRADKPGTKSYEFVSSKSPNKRPDLDSDAGKAEVMRTIDGLADVFIANVASYRGCSPEKVESEFGKGGVLLGKAAVDAGMADAIGDFEGTLARLGRGERLPAKPVPQSKPGRPKAVANNPKGSAMALNPFAVLSNLWKSDPAAVAKAIESAESARSGDDDFADVLAKLAKPPAPAAAPAVDADAIRKQIEATVRAEAEAANKATLAKFFGAQATAFCAAQVKAGRFTPADSPAVSALYVELALADHAGPIAVGGDKTSDRLSLLTTIVERKPAVNVTAEHVTTPDAVDGTVLPTVTVADGKGVNSARVLEMLKFTDAGQSALAALKTKAV